MYTAQHLFSMIRTDVRRFPDIKSGLFGFYGTIYRLLLHGYYIPFYLWHRGNVWSAEGGEHPGNHYLGVWKEGREYLRK